MAHGEGERVEHRKRAVTTSGAVRVYGDNARPTICAEGFVELTRGITQRKEPFNGSDAQRATIGNNDVPLASS